MTDDPPRPQDQSEEDHRHGHRQRLRKRFARVGANGLQDYELLELVLFRSIPQRDVKPLAKLLISQFGSVAEVIGAPMTRLLSIKGLGEQTALDIKIIEAAGLTLADIGEIVHGTTLVTNALIERKGASAQRRQGKV